MLGFGGGNQANANFWFDLQTVTQYSTDKESGFYEYSVKGLISINW